MGGGSDQRACNPRLAELAEVQAGLSELTTELGLQQSVTLMTIERHGQNFEAQSALESKTQVW